MNGFAHAAAAENASTAIGMLHDLEHAIHALTLKKAKVSTLAAGFAETYADGRKSLEDGLHQQGRRGLPCVPQSTSAPLAPLSALGARLAGTHGSPHRRRAGAVPADRSRHDLSLITNLFRRRRFESAPGRNVPPDCHRCQRGKDRIRATARPLARRLYALPPREMERLITGLWPAAKSLARHRKALDRDAHLEQSPLSEGTD